MGWFARDTVGEVQEWRARPRHRRAPSPRQAKEAMTEAMNKAMMRRALNKIAEIFLNGRNDFCPACQRRQGYAFYANEVRAVLTSVEAEARLAEAKRWANELDNLCEEISRIRRGS